MISLIVDLRASPTVCHSSLAFVLFGKKVKITPPTVLQTGLLF
jgi:hypothetical protein